MLANIRRTIAISILMSLVFVHFAAAAPEGQAETQETAPEIKSPSAIVVDAGRNQVLYSKNSDARLHVSAACKLMTAAVVIDSAKENLDARVTISKESVDSEGSALSLDVGGKYTIEDLLFGIMLTSANDAALALAEYVGGDIAAFVSLMNTKADALNMADTHFTNPTGLYDEAQYTTARDLATLVSHASSDPVYNKFLSAQFRSWYTHDGNTQLLQSQNQLFWQYDGVDGGKIGYNFKEQMAAVTTVTRDDRRLICIVLNSPQDVMYEDSIKLLDYGFYGFKTSILAQKGDPQTSIFIGDEEISLVCDNNVYYTHPIGQSYIKDIKFNIVQDLKPPIYKNKIVGTAKFILEDDTEIDVNLLPERDIIPPDDFYTSLYKQLTQNSDILFLLIFLISLEAVLILYHLVKFVVRLIRKLSSNGNKKAGPA